MKVWRVKTTLSNVLSIIHNEKTFKWPKTFLLSDSNDYFYSEKDLDVALLELSKYLSL